MRTLLRYFFILIFFALLVELLYYSLRETIKDYFYETDAKIAGKKTASDSEQSQIILNLVNQQSKLQANKDLVQNDAKNTKSASAKGQDNEQSQTMLQQSDIQTAPLDGIMLTDSKQFELLNKNSYVVVDCDKGVVLACPLHPVMIGTSPMFYAEGSNDFLVGRCKNVSVNVKSFCP